jgi:hypothetical protein
LTEIVFGHLPAEPFEDRSDRRGKLRITMQLATGCVRDALPSHVVRRRSQTAGDDDRVGSVHRAGDGLAHARHVVADDGVEVDIDTDGGQRLRDRLRVRVGDLSQEQLGSDSYDLGVHPTSSRAL